VRARGLGHAIDPRAGKLDPLRAHPAFLAEFPPAIDGNAGLDKDE
jgi:hypothetical protein